MSYKEGDIIKFQDMPSLSIKEGVITFVAYGGVWHYEILVEVKVNNGWEKYYIHKDQILDTYDIPPPKHIIEKLKNEL